MLIKKKRRNKPIKAYNIYSKYLFKKKRKEKKEKYFRFISKYQFGLFEHKQTIS